MEDMARKRERETIFTYRQLKKGEEMFMHFPAACSSAYISGDMFIKGWDVMQSCLFQLGIGYKMFVVNFSANLTRIQKNAPA